MTDNDTPKYQRIADDLREAIRSGRYAPGDRLPGENRLAEDNGVAVMTARHAVRVLQDEGLVEARKGAGVFVKQAAPVAAVTTTGQAGPSPVGEIIREVMESPERSARLAEAERRLTAAAQEAAVEVYEALLGNRNDEERKLAATLMWRAHVEHVVRVALNGVDLGTILP